MTTQPKKRNRAASIGKPTLHTEAALLFVIQRKNLPDFDKLMNRHGANVVHTQEQNKYAPPHKELTLTGQNQTLYSISLPGNW